ncbi:MAG: DUF4136 domain-containing protein [Colwellia sp.]
MKPYVCYVLIILSIISSCSSNQRASVIYHNRFDFSQVQSYSTYERNSPFNDEQHISDVRRNGIELAIDKTMASQGFEYSEFAHADIILSYHIMDLDPRSYSRSYSRYNKSVLFCESCLKASAWIIEDLYSNLAPGSLIVDLLNPKNKRSVWRSVFPLDINDKDNSQEAYKKIQQAISIMLAKYPQTTDTKHR